MRKWTWLLSILLFLFTAPAFADGKAVLLEVNSAISPSVQDYITRGIAHAADTKAKVVIIQLNTPGGLETSMRGINAAIIASPVPVITYVSPSGARAASAGTFIMYASHFAIMAPGTNIGAASPVHLTPETKSDATKVDTHEKKAMNDAAAYIRSLAQLRGRNAEWGEQAVTKAVSVSAAEAKKLNVINDVATSIPQLLTQVNGKKALIGDQIKIVDTTNLQIESMPPDWRSKFLAFITDPNVAYLLMLAALYGLFFEFSNPGLILPGVAGVIALLLALYAFQLMPINYVGLALIVIGVGFMVLELYVTSYGAIGIGGIIAFIVGSIMLYDSNDPTFRVTSTLIFAMSTITAAFFFLIIYMVIRSHKKIVITGQEALIGSEGTVIETGEGKITIRLMGEIWSAESNSMLAPGQHVKVVKSEGLTLTVKPINKEE